jgi:hypothetical protein
VAQDLGQLREVPGRQAPARAGHLICLALRGYVLKS